MQVQAAVCTGRRKPYIGGPGAPHVFPFSYRIPDVREVLKVPLALVLTRVRQPSVPLSPTLSPAKPGRM